MLIFFYGQHSRLWPATLLSPSFQLFLSLIFFYFPGIRKVLSSCLLQNSQSFSQDVPLVLCGVSMLHLFLLSFFLTCALPMGHKDFMGCRLEDGLSGKQLKDKAALSHRATPIDVIFIRYSIHQMKEYSACSLSAFNSCWCPMWEEALMKVVAKWA